MKKMISTCLILIYSTMSFALSADDTKLVRHFIATIKSNDPVKIATVIKYPLEVDPIIKPINNENEFSARFAEIFDQTLMSDIIKSDLENDWERIGWRGIALDSGIVWIDDDGKLIGTNYQTQTVKTLRKNLISQQKQSLHESVRNFQEPVLDWQTKSYRLRVDQMSENKFRLALWSADQKISEQPQVIIENGELDWDGSGGNHHYSFQQKDLTYRLDVIVLGGENFTDQLTLLKGEKELLNEPVLINHYKT